jgi:hypothetical protein
MGDDSLKIPVSSRIFVVGPTQSGTVYIFCIW